MGNSHKVEPDLTVSPNTVNSSSGTKWQHYVRPNVYVFLIIAVPYLILASIDGFPKSFHYGEASIFMCGIIVAMFGEAAIQQVD